MSDGNPINVIFAHSFLHNENIQSSHFSKLEKNLKPYPVKINKSLDLDSQKPINNASKFSSLSNLISNPAILARIENIPFLRAAILSNPSLAEVFMNSPALLNIVINNPGLITTLINNPDILPLIKDNLIFLSEIVKNPNLSIEYFLERLSKKSEASSFSNTKSVSKPHLLEMSTIAAEKTRPIANKVPSSIEKSVNVESLEIQKQQSSQILKSKILKSEVSIKIPVDLNKKLVSYLNPRSFLISPSLLALLGAAAFASNKGRIVPVSGGLKDIGVELETQSESQSDATQESEQIIGIGEIGEIHSVSEASI